MEEEVTATGTKRKEETRQRKDTGKLEKKETGRIKRTRCSIKESSEGWRQRRWKGKSG